ncbi:shikimate kinase, chloroplastic-like isoform X2 [Silene latifolia]|uniref:shikimate kinase, chloroplastic-like isoform X2 n=1 Tax=Silene latifolia TaxID=37657 RepID=UPI003D781586
MEAKLVQSIQPCSWMNSQKMITKPNGFIRVPHKSKEMEGFNLCFSLQTNKRTSPHHRQLAVKVSSLSKNSQGPVVESGGVPAALDESLVLKIAPYLNGRCIYLVGMMGSGKTTIGKLLAEVLDYSFFDSDSLVETLEGMSVAEMFNQHGEGFFREKETKVLEEVSTKHHLVISTGGGAVIRPINWRHMQSGVSVWLDVPIDCLARRISAVGTGTRPLLHGEGGDAYTKAHTRLSELFEKRHKAYANANARVSLEHIAGKLGKVDVDNLSPSVITIEVLEQIERFLRENNPAI